MRQTDISNMPVAQIMQAWPRTVPEFLRQQLYCVGCPISRFHTLADAAREHDAPVSELEAAMLSAMARREAEQRHA